MNAPDVRTTAQAEAERRIPGDFSVVLTNYKQGFADGAVWGAALVTPTREQIAIALAKQKVLDWDAMPGVMHLAVIQAHYPSADAVLELFNGGK